jgi:hypothetical protein
MENAYKLLPQTDERNCHATYLKRNNGLIKKAMELSLLCDCEISLVVSYRDKKVTTFSSRGDLQGTVNKYTSGVIKDITSHTNDDVSLFPPLPSPSVIWCPKRELYLTLHDGVFVHYFIFYFLPIVCATLWRRSER